MNNQGVWLESFAVNIYLEYLQYKEKFANLQIQVLRSGMCLVSVSCLETPTISSPPNHVTGFGTLWDFTGLFMGYPRGPRVPHQRCIWGIRCEQATKHASEGIHPGQTSPEAQNSGIIGPTKKGLMSSKKFLTEKSRKITRELTTMGRGCLLKTLHRPVFFLWWLWI